MNINYYTHLFTNNNTIACGDFNAHNIMRLSNDTDQPGHFIETLINNLNLTLLNDDTPTFIDLHHNSSILDLAMVTASINLHCHFTVSPHRCDSYYHIVHIRVGTNHHNALFVNPLSKSVEAKLPHRHDLKQANWSNFVIECNKLFQIKY